MKNVAIVSLDKAEITEICCRRFKVSRLKRMTTFSDQDKQRLFVVSFLSLDVDIVQGDQMRL
jgi:hypothetical protein